MRPTPSRAIWSAGPNSAQDDYKELPRELRAAILDAAETALVEVPLPELSADEGELVNGLLFRRAATREQMASLQGAEDGDASTPVTVGYYFIYRRLTALERAHHDGAIFLIHRIVDNLNLAWIYEQTLMQKKR